MAKYIIIDKGWGDYIILSREDDEVFDTIAEAEEAIRQIEEDE